MSKKSKPSKHKKTLLTSTQQIDKQIDLAGQQIFRNDYLKQSITFLQEK